jgi:hypothetical protein
METSWLSLAVPPKKARGSIVLRGPQTLRQVKITDKNKLMNEFNLGRNRPGVPDLQNLLYAL